MTTAAANPKAAAVKSGIKDLIESLKAHHNFVLIDTASGQFEQYVRPISGRCQGLLAWYRDTVDPVQCYWRKRDRTVEIVAYGAAGRATKLSALNDTKERWLGAFPFMWDANSSSAEGQATLFLPKIEIARRGLDAQIICRAHRDNAVSRLELIEKLKILLEPATHNPTNARVTRRRDLPIQDNWGAMIAEAHRAMQRGELAKVVLARASELSLSEAVSDEQLLRALEPVSEGSYLVAFRDHTPERFISVSPERLYYRQDREIETEAVAGTRPRGINASDDTRLREELLASAKDGEEHRIVQDVLDTALSYLTQMHTPEVTRSIVALPTLQHICLRLSGTLRNEVTDQEILASLHPTPAVGGYPQSEARAFIRRHEPFTRQWYAGAFGYFSAHEAEFAVGIRAAKIEERRMTLYAGAGIVSGSDPASEWLELDHKIRLWLDLFEQ